MTCTEFCLEKLENAECLMNDGQRAQSIAGFREVIRFAAAWKVTSVEAAAHERLAELERESGNVYTAESEYREAIALWMAVLPPDHRHLVLLRGSLAVLCHELRHYGDADLIASHALRIAEGSSDETSIAIARNNLAALRLVSPSPWLASELLALQAADPCGTDAAMLHNLGLLEFLRGRYRESICLLSWAEVLLETELGPASEVLRACTENLCLVRALGCCRSVEAPSA